MLFFTVTFCRPVMLATAYRFCCLVLFAIANCFFLSTGVACYCLTFLSVDCYCFPLLTISFCQPVLLIVAYRWLLLPGAACCFFTPIACYFRFGYLVLLAALLLSVAICGLLLVTLTVAFYCLVLQLLSFVTYCCLVLAIFFAVAYCCCLLLAVIYCRFLLPGARVS